MLLLSVKEHSDVVRKHADDNFQPLEISITAVPSPAHLVL